MKAVMAEAPASLLAERRRTGAHQWDEVWDGVLHMPAMPNREHQTVEFQLHSWLDRFWARPFGNRVFQQINLTTPGGWPDQNYRVPDLLLLTPDRFGIDKNEYFEGAPKVVVEIRSPHDESYEKLGFYAELGVPEVWIVERDGRFPEIFELRSADYQLLEADELGWLSSSATCIQLRHEATTRQLAIRLTADHSSLRLLPQ